VSAGAVIGQAWALYKAHFRHLIAISVAVYALIALLTLVLIAALGDLGVFMSAFVSVAGVFWLQGALVIAVDDVRDGRADLSLRETLERVRPRLNTLSLAALLVAVATVIAAFLIAVGFLVLILPGLILLALFLWALVRWIVVVPVIMLERGGVFGSFDRSAALVRGHGWTVLGVILLTTLILIGIYIAVSVALFPLPNSWQGFVAQIVSSTLTAPFAALAWTLMYYELRGLGDVAPVPAL
jgi:hypothetical protein